DGGFYHANANGTVDNNQPGIFGIRVYDDATNNSKFDNGERFTFSGFGGRYQLVLSPGVHNVREVVATGASETVAPGPITLGSGQIVSDANFGLTKAGPVPGFDGSDSNLPFTLSGITATSAFQTESNNNPTFMGGVAV